MPNGIYNNRKNFFHLVRNIYSANQSYSITPLTTWINFLAQEGFFFLFVSPLKAAHPTNFVRGNYWSLVTTTQWKKNTYQDTPEIWIWAGPFGKNLDLSVVVEAEHALVLGIVLDHGPADAQQRWKISSLPSLFQDIATERVHWEAKKSSIPKARK